MASYLSAKVLKLLSKMPKNAKVIMPDCLMPCEMFTPDIPVSCLDVSSVEFQALFFDTVTCRALRYDIASITAANYESPW